MKPKDDLISRKAAINVIDKRLNELCGKHLNGKTFQNRTFKDGIYDGYYRIRSDIQIIPSAQPETHEKRTETHACDCISRQAAMEEISKQQTYKMFEGEDTLYLDANDVGSVLASLPSAEPEMLACGEGVLNAQPEQTNSWCNGCKEYDHERKCCPRYNRVIRQTLDEAYAHGETEAEYRFHKTEKRCDTCRHEKSQWFNRCADCFEYELWEKKE